MIRKLLAFAIFCAAVSLLSWRTWQKKQKAAKPRPHKAAA